jgi:hypothetical protein
VEMQREAQAGAILMWMTVNKNLLTVRKKLHIHNLVRTGYTDFLTSNFFLTVSIFLLTRRKPFRLVRID